MLIAVLVLTGLTFIGILFTMGELQELREDFMSKADDIKASVEGIRTALDAATDELANDLKALRDEIATGIAGGLSAAEADEVLAALDASLKPIVTRLEVLGQDPANPVPEPVDPPTA